MQRTLQVKVLDPRWGAEWPLPAYGTAASAALDLRAALDAPLVLAPGDAALVPSGLAIHLADPALCALVLPRSGSSPAIASRSCCCCRSCVPACKWWILSKTAPAAVVVSATPACVDRRAMRGMQ